MRCSDASREAGEPLGGTATTADHWLLVEVRQGWSREVATSDALPDAARAAVGAWLERTPGSRLLFIRRPARTAGPILAFVVHAPETGGTVRRFELPGHEALADVDFDVDGRLSRKPLVLVCGHGARDACCALRGTAVFGALASNLGEEELWLSSHQGGHRFAANVVVLPAAVQLGRLEAEAAGRVVRDVLEGRIDLARYRGRTCHEPVVQVADHAMRVSGGLDRVGDLRLVAVSGSTVRLRGPDGIVRSVEIAEVPGPVVPVSCGLDAEPQTLLVGTAVEA